MVGDHFKRACMPQSKANHSVANCSVDRACERKKAKNVEGEHGKRTRTGPLATQKRSLKRKSHLEREFAEKKSDTKSCIKAFPPTGENQCTPSDSSSQKPGSSSNLYPRET